MPLPRKREDVARVFNLLSSMKFRFYLLSFEWEITVNSPNYTSGLRASRNGNKGLKRFQFFIFWREMIGCTASSSTPLDV